MDALSKSIHRNARVIPVSKGNLPVSMTKHEDGSMTVVQGNGNIFTIEASDKDMQVFVIFAMLGGTE
jgi:hypothetical protein